jgi:triacylglycerol esterase/lipase EstA (alpha/beta hydrolase family)
MTTAITLAFAVLAGTLAYVGWALREIAGGANPLWFVAGLPVAALAVPALLTGVWMTLSWLYRAPRPPGIRVGIKGLVDLYRREVLAIAGSVPRMIGYRWLLRDPPPAPAAAPVLLLHGVLCNAGVWRPLAKYLTAHGIGPIYTLSYGPPLASIDLFADQLAEKIDAIVAATGAPRVVIVGHSMGGLVARAYLRRYGIAKVCRLITLGTPHHGSLLASTFPGAALAQMRPGNAWLAELGATPAEALPPIVSLWSWHDSMVVPQTSSVFEHAENVALAGTAHNALLTDPAVQARVAAAIVAVGAPEARSARLPPRGQ